MFATEPVILEETFAMRPFLALCVLFSSMIASCQTSIADIPVKESSLQPASGKQKNPYIHINDIPLPEGYYRLTVMENSFAAWLRNLSLKKDKTVYLFNGAEKRNQEAQFAVLDISRGDKDLQQCADAVMRLRAEYLFAQNRFEEILFTDYAGKAYQFTEPYNRQHFQQYLEKVFGMCGSASLAKQLKARSIEKMEIGDVIIRGGFPGHAVIITDMAENKNGERIFMMAQSYMPAQDIHILRNLNREALSPWYRAEDYREIYTPEYTFKKTELRTW